jgi:hypothetical protein
MQDSRNTQLPLVSEFMPIQVCVEVKKLTEHPRRTPVRVYEIKASSSTAESRRKKSP